MLPPVIERPDIPVHANGSEGDIRDPVKWRKIGDGTRGDPRGVMKWRDSLKREFPNGVLDESAV